MGLGYAVVIANGMGAAIELVAKGRIEGVIGVAGLETLGKINAKLALEAIPIIGVPFCRETDGVNLGMDLEGVRRALRIRSASGVSSRLDFEALTDEVQEWLADGGQHTGRGC